MKINFNLNEKKVAFSGYTTVKDDKGNKCYEFSYPYDPDKTNCYLELFSLKQDNHGNYKMDKIIRNREGKTRIPLGENGQRFNLTREFGITNDVPFAYHYILENKSNHTTKPAIDAGDSIDERPGKHSEDDSRVYNIVTANQTCRNIGGAMRLVIADSQHVGYIYDENNKITYDKALDLRGQNAVKTLVNKFGGTLAGIEQGLINGDYKTDIIALPYTDQTNVYWTKNLFQTDPSLGNINNFASMQRTMFTHDKRYVSDGAFVNEGLEGIHFNHILKWGEDSPYFRWFRAQGLKDKPFNLGIFSRDHENITHKLVNSPISYEQNASGDIKRKRNRHYDATKPTYIQFLDKKFVTPEELKDNTKLLKTYSKLNTDYIYDTNTNNHTISPYHIEIDPKHYDKNIDNVIEYNSNNLKNETIYLDSYMATKLLSQSENYTVDEGFESGFETWDANPDIGKLNFGFSNADNKTLMNMAPEERQIEINKILRANAQVQDYTVDAGIYWTRKTNDIIRLYTAQKLKDVKNISASNAGQASEIIRNLSNDGILPGSLSAKIDNKEIRNVLMHIYNCENRKLSDEDKNSQILEGLMNFPLDSIEFGDNLTAVLASPLISKRASNFDEVGVPRYDLYKQGNPHVPNEYKLTYDKMDNLYKNEMHNYTTNVLNKINDNLPDENKLFDGSKVTEYGQYVLPLIVPQIAKYEIVKALAPDVKIKTDEQTGEIAYDYSGLKETHLQTLGITNPGSPEDEALMVLDKLQKGIKKINSDKEIVEALTKSLKDTSLNSFALADYIIDKTQTGLDWRIDATKDIADIEALKNYNMDFETTWQNVIDFWKRFSKGVLQENPHAYLVAEITCAGDLHRMSKGGNSAKFPKESDIIPKFLRETGITSTADYSYYYYNIAKMFSKSFQDGTPLSNNPNELTNHLYSIMMKSGNPFLKASSLPGILYSYTFVSNHDKPRPLHCAAMDMGLFYADLQNKDLRGFRETAYRLITDNFFGNVTDNDLKNFDFEKVSSKAVAMGMAMRKGFIGVLEDYKKDGKISDKDFHEAFDAVSKAICDMSQGKYLDKRFEPDSFAVKPIEVNIDSIIKQAKTKYGLHLPDNVNNDFSNDTFKKVIDPAIPKLLAMMKYLVALPGRPTIFDGDDMGSTGYDSETKNMYLQCRNKIHEEWITKDNPKFKQFLATHKENFDKVIALRSDPKLEPLNNGAPFMLPLQDAENQYDSKSKYKMPAILRQSTNGKITVSLLNTADKNRGYGRFPYDNEMTYEPEEIKLDSIKLNFEIQKKKDHNGNETNEDISVPMSGEWGIGIPGLKNNMKFHNALNPDDIYYVNELNGNYYIKHGSGDGKIYLSDTVLNLYYDPEEDKPKDPVYQEKFITQTPKYIANAYLQESDNKGKKLSLISK